MVLNLQLEHYKYAVRSWEESCIPETEALLEKTADALCSTLEVNPREFLAKVMVMLPKAVNDDIFELLLERDLLFAALGTYVVRLLDKYPRHIVISELEEALNSWEISAGIQMQSRLSGLKNGKTLGSDLVLRAKAAIWCMVQRELDTLEEEQDGV